MMSTLPIVLLLTAALNIIIGTAVLAANPSRIQNRLFFGVTLLLSGWTVGVVVVVVATRENVVEMTIRALTWGSTLLPVVFHAFCHSIVHDSPDARSILIRIRHHLVLSLFLGALCFTPFYVSGVELRESSAGGFHLPVAITGPAYTLVNGYIIIGLLAVSISYFVRVQECDPLRRTELGFVLLGISLGVAVALITVLILPLFFADLVPQRYGPLALVPVNLTIGYGIATRRLMNVSTLLQRLLAYVLLTLYLVALYFVILNGSTMILQPNTPVTRMMPGLLAALAVAFAMAPTHGILQRLSRKLFINVPGADMRRAARVGSEVFASISTTDEMIDRFEDAVNQAGMDPEFVAVFLKQNDHYDLAGGAARGIPHIQEQVDGGSALVKILRRTKAPVVADVLKRLRPTDELTRAAAELSGWKARVATGIFYKGELAGVVLLGPRMSGLLYAGIEQDTLSLLCDHLAVALENARLYTAVRNNQIYNDTLVDNLISGLIAVDARGRITVLNREAQRITGLTPDGLRSTGIDALPPVLAEALNRTLSAGDVVRNHEAVLRDPHAPKGDDKAETPISLGTSLIGDAQGITMGAFLVFTDLTPIKQLEQQVRRSDRLASIGTLSAGMAHEIKNPLVTIKTFTELLPERFEDRDFRDTFSSLVSQEVGRIDRIVNELLHFARPARVDLRPSSLHAAIHHALQLIEEQLHRKGLVLELRLCDDQDAILGDDNLLNQALINLLFNAIDSMEAGGRLTVETGLTRLPWHLREQSTQPDAEDLPHLRLTIQDSGQGMPAEVLGQIFDPFFTTKNHGTGLGLSISHGIFKEHRAVIDVESHVGVGTAFFIYFPIATHGVAA